LIFADKEMLVSVCLLFLSSVPTLLHSFKIASKSQNSQVSETGRSILTCKIYQWFGLRREFQDQNREVIFSLFSSLPMRKWVFEAQKREKIHSIGPNFFFLSEWVYKCRGVKKIRIFTLISKLTFVTKCFYKRLRPNFLN
jgi:hypothetical protein